MSDITFKHHDPNVMLELWHVTKRFGGLTAGPLTAEIGEFLMQKYEVPASSPRTDAIAVNW